jgi:hypothetical protein
MTVTELQSHGVAALSFPLVENLGRTLSNLMLLLIIPLLLAVTFILNLSLLIVQTLKKLGGLCKHIVTQALSVQYIVCRLGDARKSMSLTFKRLRKSVWKKDGDSLPDSTLAYSEMPGGLNKEDLEILQGKKITQEQYDKIRKQI